MQRDLLCFQFSLFYLSYLKLNFPNSTSIKSCSRIELLHDMPYVPVQEGATKCGNNKFLPDLEVHWKEDEQS
jgi:hypothetical protein